MADQPIVPNRLLTNTGRDPNLETVSNASSFTYGSYSGADIKVCVSYPINDITARIEIEKLKARQDDLKEEVEAIGTRFLQLLKFPDTEKVRNSLLARRSRALEGIDIVEQRIKYFDEWSKKANIMAATKTLAELQTVSWSIFREKSPVRTLGAVYPRSFVRGPRTIAGTMIFTLFDKSALYDFLNMGLNPYSTGTSNDRDYYHATTALIDQLPPLDLSIIANNEYGQTSYMNLWGVEFMNDGGTFSIEDLFTETVVQYSARDIDLLRPSLSRETDIFTNVLTGKPAKTSVSQLYRESANTTERARKRRNPYI